MINSWDKKVFSDVDASAVGHLTLEASRLRTLRPVLRHTSLSELAQESHARSMQRLVRGRHAEVGRARHAEHGHAKLRDAAACATLRRRALSGTCRFERCG